MVAQGGRELDAWLAEHLDAPCFACRTAFTEHPPDWHPYSPPNLSGSGDGMLLVLEAMRKRGAVELDEVISAEHGDGNASQWDVTFWLGDDLHGARHDSLPMAVALAARSALEAQQ